MATERVQTVGAAVLLERYPSKNRKTRVHAPVSRAEVLERFGLELPPFSVKGKDPEVDIAWRKYNRAEITIMRERARKWLDDNGLSDVKLSFSRKAGCSCGCSPGFIADRQIVQDRGTILDIFVD